MSAEQTAGDEKRRVESARAAVRAVGTAFKSLRMYPLGHALAAGALGTAQRLLASHATAYGALTITVPARGLTLDAGLRPYDDDVVADLARALRARTVPVVQFLPGLSAEELGELLAALHLPIQQIEREGGLGKLLRKRGVQNLIVEGAAAVPVLPGTHLDVLLAAVRTGESEPISAALLESIATAEQAADLLRDLDRRVVTWPKIEQTSAWRIVGQALASVQAPWQRPLGAMILKSDEPWALSIAAQWPPALAAALAPGDAQTHVRTLHRQLPRTALPEAAALRPDELDAAAATFARWTKSGPHAHALRRFTEMLPALDTRRFTECLDELVERAIVQLVEEDDSAALLSVLTGLVEATRRVTDVRADLLRAALHRIMTLSARDLFERILAAPVTAEHPLAQAMQVAPAETVGALLELAGEEERLAVRRSVVDLLTMLTAGRHEVLAEHVVDSRWHIARNAVSVLRRLGGPDIVPYLRAAMEHDDSRVRREAMRALAEVGTVDAVEMLAGALYAGDQSSREAAAHWLGMIALPEAVEALAVLFHGSSLAEDLEVKREAIRSLARLGGARAVETLQHVAASGAPLMRRRAVDELRQEAAAALAQMGSEA